MNEIINNILTRRSVRDFSDKLVGKDDMETLMLAALCAPSGMNKQTWKFTGVLNQDIIKKLAGTIGEILGRDNYEFYGATALIITSNEKESSWAKEDNACALENIFLAAHSLDIGSVWINQFGAICDNQNLREILTQIGIPQSHGIYGVAALGYSKSAAKGIVEKVGEFTIIE